MPLYDPLEFRGQHLEFLHDATPEIDLDLAKRFWRHVRKTDRCWEWTGTRNHGGYGVFGYSKGISRTAHRVAWMLTHGPIPDETPCVLHRCDNPRCVRPEHLFLGTLKDNTQDCIAKWRYTMPPNRLLKAATNPCFTGGRKSLRNRPLRALDLQEFWKSIDDYSPEDWSAQPKGIVAVERLKNRPLRGLDLQELWRVIDAGRAR